jgi:hypothetical protein
MLVSEPEKNAEKISSTKSASRRAPRGISSKPVYRKCIDGSLTARGNQYEPG